MRLLLTSLMMLCGFTYSFPLANAQEQTDRPKLGQVVLYSAGLGAFQFEASLEGATTLRLPFASEHVNDVLRTLTVEDPESKLKYVRVETPGNKPVESSLNINSLLELLVELRGEEMHLFLKEGKQHTGRLLAVEKSMEALNEEMVERVRISIASQNGITTCLFEDVERFECVDAEIQQKITSALTGLHAVVEEDLVEVELGFAAGPKRNIRFGYLHSMPVWKTSYTLTEEDLTLRVLVDNVSKQDWDDIDLTVIDGQPVSFEIDLRQIARLHRERLPLPIGLPGIPPILAESTLDSAASNLIASSRAHDSVTIHDFSSSYVGGGGYGGYGGASGVAGLLGGAEQQGQGQNTSGQQTSQGLQQRLGLATQAQIALESDGGGASFVMTFEDISLPAGTANLLTSPKLEVSSDFVSIFLHGRQATSKIPYMGTKLVNRSQVLLPPGPVSVFSESSFLGDAMIPRLSPGRARLVSFAIDAAVRVEPQPDQSTESIVAIHFDQEAKRLHIRRKTVQSRAFKISNRSPEPRTVEIETDFAGEAWKVDLQDGDEQLANILRLECTVAPRQDLVRVATRSSEGTDVLSYGSSDLDSLRTLSQQKEIAAAARGELKNIIQQRVELANIQRRLKDAELAVRDFASEVDRLIQINMTSAFNAETAAKYAKKLDEAEEQREALRELVEQLKEVRDDVEVELFPPENRTSRNSLGSVRNPAELFDPFEN